MRGAAVIFLVLLGLPGVCFAAEPSASEKRFQDQQRREWKRYYAGGAQKEIPQTSLAVEFFNQAVEAYQGHDYELAREALSESLKLNARNAYAHELLGDMAVEENDLPGARESYRQAYLLQPSDKLREKMEKAGREVRLDGEHQEFAQGHFQIRASRDIPEEELMVLARELETIYDRLEKFFGYAPREPLTVVLYEREEFAELTRLPHWVGGLYDGKIRLPAYDRGVLDADFEALAAHEMTHAFIGRLSRRKAPAWLQEGLAVSIENEIRPRDFTVLRLAVKTRTLLPLDQLMNEEKVSREKDALFASLFYEQSWSLLQYLLKKYGMFKVRSLLTAFSKGKNYDEALRDSFSIEAPMLETKWKKYVTKQYPPSLSAA